MKLYQSALIGAFIVAAPFFQARAEAGRIAPQKQHFSQFFQRAAPPDTAQRGAAAQMPDWHAQKKKDESEPQEPDVSRIWPSFEPACVNAVLKARFRSIMKDYSGLEREVRALRRKIASGDYGAFSIEENGLREFDSLGMQLSKFSHALAEQYDAISIEQLTLTENELKGSVGKKMALKKQEIVELSLKTRGMIAGFGSMVDEIYTMRVAAMNFRGEHLAALLLAEAALLDGNLAPKLREKLLEVCLDASLGIGDYDSFFKHKQELNKLREAKKR